MEGNTKKGWFWGGEDSGGKGGGKLVRTYKRKKKVRNCPFWWKGGEKKIKFLDDRAREREMASSKGGKVVQETNKQTTERRYQREKMGAQRRTSF